MSAGNKRQITLMVGDKVHEQATKLAKTAGMSLTAYVTLLFEAAYAARCKETGDIDLDTAVSRVALLFGSEFDIAGIRQATGLSEVFVGRTISAWQKEMRQAPLPMQREARA